ncbi:hypothetical protein TNCV_1960471 [Trichonephila clavipes]|nr:hypothetical protein TNCV_1960471 [Trichonephila clavipes]
MKWAGRNLANPNAENKKFGVSKEKGFQNFFFPQEDVDERKIFSWLTENWLVTLELACLEMREPIKAWEANRMIKKYLEQLKSPNHPINNRIMSKNYINFTPGEEMNERLLQHMSY